MKKIVVTIKDEVCLKNGKDEASQAKLLEVLTHYGTVEDYSKHVAVLETAWQKSLDDMTAQYNAIVEQALTKDEISMVKAYRDCKADIAVEYTTKIDELTTTMQKIKEKHEQTKALILSQLGE